MLNEAPQLLCPSATGRHSQVHACWRMHASTHIHNVYKHNLTLRCRLSVPGSRSCKDLSISPCQWRSLPDLSCPFWQCLSIAYIGLPLGHFPSIFILATALMFSVSSLLFMCPNDSNLFLLMTAAIGSTLAFLQDLNTITMIIVILYILLERRTHWYRNVNSALPPCQCRTNCQLEAGKCLSVPENIKRIFHINRYPVNCNGEAVWVDSASCACECVHGSLRVCVRCAFVHAVCICVPLCFVHVGCQITWQQNDVLAQ